MRQLQLNPLSDYLSLQHKEEKAGWESLEKDLDTIVQLLAVNHDEAEIRLEKIAQLQAMRRSITDFFSESESA